MAYTTIDDPSAHFQTALYTGSGSDNAVTNGGNSDLQADLLLCKRRNDTGSTLVFDSSRGFNGDNDSLYMETIGYDAETHNDNDHLKSFNSDGFTMQGASSRSNRSSDSFVAWQWKANGGTRTTNTESGDNPGGGYQANTTAGFSIVDYVGTGATGTKAHGLGAVPEFIIYRNRADWSWAVYHHSLGNTLGLYIDSTAAQTSTTTWWNSTSPTSTNLSLHTNGGVNQDGGNIIAYCFKGIQGYSKFGSFTGNGNDNGPSIYTGFKPSLVIVKRTNNSGAWHMYSSSATGIHKYNEITTRIEIDDASAAKEHVYYQMDFLSNGFKFWEEGDNINGSGDTMIYCAWAEFPFVSSDGVPATAV